MPHNEKDGRTVSSSTSPQGVESGIAVMTATLTQLWLGQDYYNPFRRTGLILDEPFKDTVDRHEHPRMPWQDIGACVFGDGARDVARHFVQRWNFIKTEKKKSFAGYPLLLPRDGSLPLNDESDPLTNLLKESVNCEIQVLRSCGEWSSGLPLEQSILNAYLNLIEQAEHFIYIEVCTGYCATVSQTISIVVVQNESSTVGLDECRIANTLSSILFCSE
jgi:phospholipase D1/2